MTREPVGSVGEEAAKLFAALQDNQNNGYAAGQRETHTGHRLGPECQWCPLCQLISLVWQAKPETVDQLASAAAGVLGSLRSWLDAAAESARAARAEHAGAPEEPAPKPERIDVSEDPEPWD
jgi:hypothetical protein